MKESWYFSGNIIIKRKNIMKQNTRKDIPSEECFLNLF